MLKIDFLFRVVGGEVVKKNFAAGYFRVLIVDRVHLEEREVAFAFLGGPNLAGYRISGADIEPSYLRGRYVNIIGTGR